ncbi:MAG: hypothetical protein WC824_15925, partial [Bacteroidota bacterium]
MRFCKSAHAFTYSLQEIMALLRPKQLTALLLALFALILLPALLYTGYEVSRLGAGEKEISSIYERQLDAVLFSVNQYAWDVTGGWLTTLHTSVMQPDALSPARQGSGSITELESETRTRAENQAGSIPGKLGEVAHDSLPA